MTLFPDRLSGQSVTFFNQPAAKIKSGFMGNKNQITPQSSDRVPLTGYEPHAGARSFSFGPWNSKDIPGQSARGPSANDVRTRRDRKNYSD